MTTHDSPSPLTTGDPHAWDRVIDALGPASMIAALACRMGPDLRARIQPEDLWQETLLLAWRSRDQFTWQGLTSFRRWLLQIAQNRLRNWIEHQRTEKRGGDAVHVPLGMTSQGSVHAGPMATTTPSRALSDAEEARLVHSTLESLPEDLRAVVRLRLLEGLQIDEIAAELDVGAGAVRHRLRKGAELFELRLRQRHGGAAGARSATNQESAAPDGRTPA